jgi:hypothetical protein
VSRELPLCAHHLCTHHARTSEYSIGDAFAPLLAPYLFVDESETDSGRKFDIIERTPGIEIL